MKQSVRFAFIVIGLLFACCFALNAQEEQKNAAKPEPRLTNWYKIEVTMSEFDDGKKVNTRTYTVNAQEDGSPATIKLGDRVPVGTNPPANTQFTYIDVGLNINCYVRERQGRLGVTIGVDQSGITASGSTMNPAPNQPIIRQLKTENTAFVSFGRPTLMASVDDPSKANHRYTVEATVTKLNP